MRTHLDICFKFQITVRIMVHANDNEFLLVFLCIAKIFKNIYIYFYHCKILHLAVLAGNYV